jgi:hypothetical protein
MEPESAGTIKEETETKTFKVRCATDMDADAIARLSAELGYPTPHETMRQRIHAISASSADLLVVATDPSGEPVGWLQAHAAQLIESGSASRSSVSSYPPPRAAKASAAPGCRRGALGQKHPRPSHRRAQQRPKNRQPRLLPGAKLQRDQDAKRLP